MRGKGGEVAAGEGGGRQPNCGVVVFERGGEWETGWGLEGDGCAAIDPVG